jgi:hypothetical protein
MAAKRGRLDGAAPRDPRTGEAVAIATAPWSCAAAETARRPATSCARSSAAVAQTPVAAST